ncbi:MAG: response regulator [Spirochaetes bacterium]|nr:response regulator [Spirochaetota bacterium]
MDGNACISKKKAILCVDDEVIIVYSLKQELVNHFGDAYQYRCATSAAEGMAVLDELDAEGIEVAVIITDWLMPGMKGDDFLMQVRKTHQGIKSVLITGQADQEAVERAKRDAGVSTVLRKPWHPQDLIDAIQSA